MKKTLKWLSRKTICVSTHMCGQKDIKQLAHGNSWPIWIKSKWVHIVLFLQLFCRFQFFKKVKGKYYQL